MIISRFPAFNLLSCVVGAVAQMGEHCDFISVEIGRILTHNKTTIRG